MVKTFTNINYYGIIDYTKEKIMVALSRENSSHISKLDFPAQKMLVDLFHAIDKVKKIDQVIEIGMYSGDSRDVFHLYITVEKETIKTNDEILKNLISWEEDYLVFPEVHIVEKNDKKYIPKGIRPL